MGKTLEELEKDKQKVLIKLNNVFGNPRKEAQLNDELDKIESEIEALRSGNSVSEERKKSYLSTGILSE
ncbi:MAG: hypothetical protein ACI4G0_01660, partial [Ruminococcus sp.]